MIYSAGTFGQQLVTRFRETEHCNVVAWIDDDYWEYRRCCLDVDPIESITGVDYDYILVATVNEAVAQAVIGRLQDLGVSRDRILTISVPEDKEALIHQFLDVNSLQSAEEERKKGTASHA